MLTIVQ